MSVDDAAELIIGRGLLGRAVLERLRPGTPAASVRWGDADQAVDDLVAAANAVIASARGGWQLYWCAGAGVTATSAEALETEVAVFRRFLTELEDLPEQVRHRGTVFLASSVGGAYAGAGSPPYDEHSPTRALSPYGVAKLKMEQALADSSASSGIRSFIARITNLYGPGQDLSKGQGLISTIARTYITNQPASIFVPLDTIRDYVYAADCAAVIVAGVARTRGLGPGSSVVKVIGSSHAVSIGALVGEFGRLMRRPPLIVLGAGNASGQAPDLRVRSAVWPDLDALISTTLPEGISRTHRSLLRSASTGRAFAGG
ncbi:NAD-dependent epimerase/dehydratase family protein [Microcella daejeonensis]|uniref:NAD-dependent epimerase/dehydratase family protein n=1 Tax=Microcella daejeonensis TaxID=2994971 RepID=A0A9E8MLU7_9MICO|nr:NAD-dependent epimerase/dehydratase family protein [Microcella daejeonensis]WAB81873.1 NAD-dependent epimerase/dehydratase family protein [Microcella daejeonensis]